MDYNARYYSPVLGRFVSADTVVPEAGNPQAWNRYAYVENNPIGYTDPTGHKRDPSCGCAGLSRKAWTLLARRYEQAAEVAGNSYRGTLNEYLFAQAGQYHNLSEGNYIAAQTQGDIIEGALQPRLAAAGYYGDDVAIDTILAASGPDLGEGVTNWVGGAAGAGTATAAITFSYKGGRYKNLQGGPGIEKHHMPADSVSPLSREDGPAIEMDMLDHRRTASWGSGTDAKNYRDLQKTLIDQGRFDDAIQMDIDNVQSIFGDKYDKAILDMIDSLD
jgi:hypothetical protein